MAFQVGQRVGDYEIVQLLGVGGMGSVYRVRNVISDRTEAMKVLLPDLTAERDLAVRFIAEIRTLASFDHPNIALLHTAFQADNQLVMMMEFVEGFTLEQRARQSPMTIAEVSGYTYQALSALSYAHSRGVIHRDIKPANIMLTSHGIVKLMDFGIAKSRVETNLTRPGTTIGSLYYMSPEQVRGDTVDGRSDLYSVGIMLYELLAGRRPFEADTTFSILNQQLNTPPQPPIELNPFLPRALSDVILHALAKSPDDRYQSADNFKDALRPFCSAQPREAAHTPNASPLAAIGIVASAMTAFEPAVKPSASTPASAAAASPQFANVGTPQARPTPHAAPRKAPAKANKTLWMGTGIAAAILAMVGLAIGLPHLLGTRAAESARTDTPQNDPARQPVISQPVEATTPQRTQTSAALTAPITNSANSHTPSSDASAAQSTKPHGTDSSPKRSSYSPPESANATSPATQPSPQPLAGPPAELEQAQDRYTEISARAGAVDISLTRLRRQQEADGYGLRGDMESADNRMQSDLRAADQDLRSASAASAAKNLTRAEAELVTLEKFLGR